MKKTNKIVLLERKYKKVRAEFVKAVHGVNKALDFFNERLDRIETEMQLHRTIVKDKLFHADIPNVPKAKNGVQHKNNFFGLFGT